MYNYYDILCPAVGKASLRWIGSAWEISYKDENGKDHWAYCYPYMHLPENVIPAWRNAITYLNRITQPQ